MTFAFRSITILTISCAIVLALALLAASVTNTQKFLLSSDQGHLPPAENGFAWVWNVGYRVGAVHVRSIVVGDPDRSIKNAFGEPAPWWSMPASGAQPPAAGIPNTIEFEDAAFGWPLPCLAYRVDHSHPKHPLYTRSDRIVYGLDLQILPTNIQSPIWPTRLLWPEFLINLALTLPFVAAAFFAPAWVRRHRRAKKLRQQRCPTCGYNRADAPADSKCPECGTTHATPAPLENTDIAQHC